MQVQVWLLPLLPPPRQPLLLVLLPVYSLSFLSLSFIIIIFIFILSFEWCSCWRSQSLWFPSLTSSVQPLEDPCSAEPPVAPTRPPATRCHCSPAPSAHQPKPSWLLKVLFILFHSFIINTVIVGVVINWLIDCFVSLCPQELLEPLELELVLLPQVPVLSKYVFLSSLSLSFSLLFFISLITMVINCCG